MNAIRLRSDGSKAAVGGFSLKSVTARRALLLVKECHWRLPAAMRHTTGLETSRIVRKHSTSYWLAPVFLMQ